MTDLIYGGKRPKSYRLAHNHIIHTPEFGHGQNGFRRFWIPPQLISEGKWKECPCGWHSHLGTHFALADHVQWWKAEIKKRGGLEAVYRYINRRLEAEFNKRRTCND
jgi:hypothetical protein